MGNCAANGGGRSGADVRHQFLEPPRHPPVGITEKLHDRGHEDHPDDRRIDEDRYRQPDPEQLDHPQVPLASCARNVTI